MSVYIYTCIYVCVYVYNIIRRSGRSDYETQSTKNLIYLYNVYKIRNIIRVSQHAQIGESLAIIRDERYHMIPDKSFVHKVRTPFPSMRPTKRFVAISRDATSSGTLCSANNNRNRIVPRSSITAAMRKRTCADIGSSRKLTSFSHAQFYNLMFYSLKNIWFLYVYIIDF